MDGHIADMLAQAGGKRRRSRKTAKEVAPKEIPQEFSVDLVNPKKEV